MEWDLSTTTALLRYSENRGWRRPTRRKIASHHDPSDEEERYGSPEDSSRLTEADAETRFIGDLVIGQRQQEETLFWRSLEIDNPTNDVYGQEIALAVTNGVIHYISVINDRGSYAVACDRPYALGSSRSSFNIRVTPNSHSYVTVVVGAH
ncbi:uncharacterized protein LOC107265070 isoform X1 [Cephus cinctus]|uniref:Uncharacterized protein LOC107265070 isoform X1 n=1 Tax=Cephus cinctus TaxID=211228 RepID=A0AAJ7VZ06_CEPCN|nr:uncharacterized protein LOC107265070 isoform X1 [Cephus cinctus]